MISRKSALLLATPLIAAALSFGTACSSDNTNCDLVNGSCTLSFNRGTGEAKASVLGVKAELINASDNAITLKVAGQQVTIPVNGNAEVAGFAVSAKSVTKDKVTVEIRKN